MGRLRSILFPFLLVLIGLLAGGCAGESSEEVGSSGSAATELPEAKQAAERLKTAVEKKEATDARMGRALARIAPMITEQQTRSFINAFEALPDVRDAAADHHRSAAALDVELARILASDTERAAVLRGITRVPPGRGATAVVVYGPTDLFEGYALLAQSPYPSKALAFAARLLAGDPKLAGVGASDDEVIERILIPALPGTYLEKLLASGSTAQATSLTKTILDVGGDKCKDVAGWLKTHDALTGNDLAADTIRVSGKSVGEALRAVAAVMAIWELGDDLARGDMDAALATFVSGGPTAIGGIASATSLFRRVLLGIEETPLADQVLRYSGRLASGIGVVLNVFTLIDSAGHWNDSPAAKVRVAADIVALGASVLVLAGAGPVGPILATVAIGIHLFADWMENRALEEQERKDLLACLPETGLSTVMVARIMNASAATVRILAEDAKLTPADLQWLMSVYEEAVASDSYTPLRYLGVLIMQKIFALDSAETTATLKAVIASQADPQRATYMLDMFLRGLEYGQGWNGDITKTEALAWLDQEGQSTLMPAGERELRRTAFRNGRSYLATVR